MPCSLVALPPWGLSVQQEEGLCLLGSSSIFLQAPKAEGVRVSLKQRTWKDFFINTCKGWGGMGRGHVCLTDASGKVSLVGTEEETGIK